MYRTSRRGLEQLPARRRSRRRGAHRAVGHFFYSPSGDSDGVRRFLKNDLVYVVQCDGTSVTTFLERAGGKRPGS